MNIRGGQVNGQTPFNPIFAGTRLTGPILAGNILKTGGAGLAGLGSTGQDNQANVGYVRMVQVGRVPQTAGAGFISPDLIIPAQSLITSMSTVLLAPFTGAAATFGIGNTVNPIAFTPAGALTAPESESIVAAVAPQLNNWINCGPVDEQLVFISSNAGTGAMLVIVEYIQGLNAPTS